MGVVGFWLRGASSHSRDLSTFCFGWFCVMDLALQLDRDMWRGEWWAAPTIVDSVCVVTSPTSKPNHVTEHCLPRGKYTVVIPTAETIFDFPMLNTTGFWTQSKKHPESSRPLAHVPANTRNLLVPLRLSLDPTARSCGSRTASARCPSDSVRFWTHLSCGRRIRKVSRGRISTSNQPRAGSACARVPFD